MKIVDWKPNTRIFITSGAETSSSKAKWNGSTTDEPSYRDGDVTKVNIIDDDGSQRAVTISRVKYVTECM